jgi:hypothetical protein
MSGPVRAFAENQLVTPILIVAYALAMATYHRRISWSVSGGWGEQER